MSKNDMKDLSRFQFSFEIKPYDPISRAMNLTSNSLFWMSVTIGIYFYVCYEWALSVFSSNGMVNSRMSSYFIWNNTHKSGRRLIVYVRDGL